MSTKGAEARQLAIVPPEGKEAKVDVAAGAVLLTPPLGLGMCE